MNVKELVLRDRQSYRISERDFKVLKRLSPGLARLVRDSDCNMATHFVCKNCGQISPIKLRELHQCQR